MSKLFEPTQIRSLELTNRFVRSATWEGLAADDGAVTPPLIDRAIELTRGGIGLIITGHAFVSPEGRAGKWQLGIYADGLIPGLMELTTAVHDLGGKIAAQLAHAGSHASCSQGGFEPMGPSALLNGPDPVSKAMTDYDIEEVINSFAAAAKRSQAAGFDAVQIHAAHGYLLSQFLSPYFNKRKDGYGGSIENRAKLASEVIKAVRSAVGPEFPVFIKINSEDFVPEGLTVEEMVQTAIMLERSGVDSIEMSGGTFLSGKYIPSRPGKPGRGKSEVYYEKAARLYKEKVSVPLMLVGGIRTIETAERLVDEGLADYLALCRPLIREPGLVNRWKSGDIRPATCVSDNGCFKPGFKGIGVHCVLVARKKTNRE